MRIILSLLVFLFGVTLCASARASGCYETSHSGARYVICSYDPARATLSLHNRDAEGKAYMGFDALFRDLIRQHRLPVFAMNGGMYNYDFSPTGFYVERGVEIKPLNTRSGFGNFHLKPNGVFWLNGGKAGVSETGAFKHANRKVQFATQSGPMLVIDGKLHPAFRAESDSLKIRNAVGVDRAGMVHFVISEDAVRFYDLATLYRDVLHCPDALFLDGSISSLYAPGLSRYDRFYPMGPIIAVTVGLPF